MPRIHIQEVQKKLGEKVTIAGFAQAIRHQGSISFLVVRDITGTVQAVVLKNTPDALATAKALSLESVVEITGEAKEAKQAPSGFEILVETLTVLSAAEPELPIPVVEKAQDETDQSIRMDWRFMDLRKSENTLIFRVWTTLEAALRDYWVSNNYIEIHSPKLLGTASESGAEVFEVKYFKRKAFLAQSPQFYKQMAMAAGFEKVFEVGPVFRAEPSFTSRHATEFTGFDAEFSYIESHQDVMAEEEKMLVAALQKISEKHGEEIEKVFGRKVVVPTAPFPKLTMKETKEILAKMGAESEREGDLSADEEKKICEYVLKEFGHEFVFITDYPSTVRPFYHMRHEDDPTLTKSFDLLWNGIEITTGAQREHRYEKLMEQAKEKKMRIESIQFYLNFFRYGCPPHGGLGMGPSRMMMKLLNIDNVRDVSFLHRGVKRLEP